MHDRPVTIGEIADLLHRIRALTDNRTAEPAARAEVLARKVDLLARIADQRTRQRNYEHADRAHQTTTARRTP